jgi:hypothetical protein
MKFSPPGHTFMEVGASFSAPLTLPDSPFGPDIHRHLHQNDRTFGGISRRSKQEKVIGSSKSWMEIAAQARNPSHDTTWMDRTKFRNWTKFLSARYQV